MATSRKIVEQQYSNTEPTRPESNLDEISLAEQLINEARQGHADFIAGWTKFTEEVGIRGEPVGAKKLRAMLLQTGINPDANEFSRELIALREE